MINLKKIFIIIITSFLTLFALSALVLFFYTIFFFERPITQKETSEIQTAESEEVSSPEVEIIEKPIEKTKETKKITKNNETQEKTTTSQNKIVIKDALYATVGNKAITKLDIVKEIKIILILSNQSFSEDNREQIQSVATQSIIKRAVKEIEINKYKSLGFSLANLENELNNRAQKLNMDLDMFKNTFIANKIDYSDVSYQIKVELLWNKLMFQLYKDRLIVNENEINDQLKIMQNKKEMKEYLISEIIIKPVPKNKLEAKIEETKNKIKIEGFEKVAMSESISETSFRGGDLGWVSENAISKKFKSQIINTPVGNISQPIILPEGILFFKVRDKKKSKQNINLDDLRSQITNAEKTKILNMYSLSHYDNLKRSISIKYF